MLFGVPSYSLNNLNLLDIFSSLGKSLPPIDNKICSFLTDDASHL